MADETLRRNLEAAGIPMEAIDTAGDGIILYDNREKLPEGEPNPSYSHALPIPGSALTNPLYLTKLTRSGFQATRPPGWEDKRAELDTFFKARRDEQSARQLETRKAQTLTELSVAKAKVAELESRMEETPKEKHLDTDIVSRPSSPKKRKKGR